jgi:hypothetical protein
MSLTVLNQLFLLLCEMLCDEKSSTVSIKEMEERELLHHTECNAYKLRIEFLEETIRNYRSLPADLLGSFDVSQCHGNCFVLRQNFWDVWNTNANLHSKFELEMQQYRDVIKEKDTRIMELGSVNGLLEKSLEQSNIQLFETRREAVESSVEENCDLEEYFNRKLEEERSILAVVRDRVAELEENLYLKEQESGARQMQINYLLSLPNQLEHASEVNMMRNKLWEADRRIQELVMQRFDHPVLIPASAPRMFSGVNIEQDQRLSSRFRDFFRRSDVDGALDAEHLEENMYDMFLLDQPNQEKHRLRPDMYVRDEIVQAMHTVCGSTEFKTKQRGLEARHGSMVRLCKRNFAACLASMGGKFKRKRGVRYWVNVAMTRKPLFSWDV